MWGMLPNWSVSRHFIKSNKTGKASVNMHIVGAGWGQPVFKGQLHGMEREAMKQGGGSLSALF
jgi:hypothetical protein